MQTKYFCTDCGQYHYTTDYWFVFDSNKIIRVTYTLEEATAYRKTLTTGKTAIHKVIAYHMEGATETTEIDFRLGITKAQRKAVIEWIAQHMRANEDLQNNINDLQL